MRGTRRPPALMAGFLLLTCLLVIVGRPDGQSAAAPAQRQAAPNIVFVLTDDMRADEIKHLPAVRALQRRGVRFANMRASDSICCPTRATILTGKYAHNHRTIGNDVRTYGGYEVFAEHNDIADVLPVWMHRAGYRTGYIGKYLNGFAASQEQHQPGWTYFATPYADTYRFFSNKFEINGVRHRGNTRYREHYTRELLLDRIAAWGPGKRPYFLFYNSLAPHATKVGGRWVAPRPEAKYRDTVDPDSLIAPPSVSESSVTGDGTPEDLADKPGWVRAYAGAVPSPGYRRLDEQRRIESLRSVDDTVRAATTAVERQGELANTIFVFSSDNGFMLGEHALEGKNKPYHESLSVPLIVAGPGFPDGRTIRSTVSFNDVTPTLTRAARYASRRRGDGVALQDVVSRRAGYAERPVLIEGSTAQIPWYADGPQPVDAIGRFYTGVTYRGFTYVRLATGEEEFYRRGRDRWEMRNAYDADAPSDMQRMLEEWHDAHVDCSGSSCNDPVAP